MIPGQGTRFHMPQLKISHATTKTQQNKAKQQQQKRKQTFQARMWKRMHFWTTLHGIPALVVKPPNHLILCPTFSSSLKLSQHQNLFQKVSSLHQWPKYWSFSFSINPSNDYSELISFMIDWFDFLARQGTLKSLPQHHSSKASVL